MNCGINRFQNCCSFVRSMKIEKWKIDMFASTKNQRKIMLRLFSREEWILFDWNVYQMPKNKIYVSQTFFYSLVSLFPLSLSLFYSSLYHWIKPVFSIKYSIIQPQMKIRKWMNFNAVQQKKIILN